MSHLREESARHAVVSSGRKEVTFAYAKQRETKIVKMTVMTVDIADVYKLAKQQQQ